MSDGKRRERGPARRPGPRRAARGEGCGAPELDVGETEGRHLGPWEGEGRRGDEIGKSRFAVVDEPKSTFECRSLVLTFGNTSARAGSRDCFECSGASRRLEGFAEGGGRRQKREREGTTGGRRRAARVGFKSGEREREKKSSSLAGDEKPKRRSFPLLLLLSSSSKQKAEKTHSRACVPSFALVLPRAPASSAASPPCESEIISPCRSRREESWPTGPPSSLGAEEKKSIAISLAGDRRSSPLSHLNAPSLSPQASSFSESLPAHWVRAVVFYSYHIESEPFDLTREPLSRPEKQKQKTDTMVQRIPTMLPLALLLLLLVAGGAPWLASSAEAAATVLRPSPRPAKGEQGASNSERKRGAFFFFFVFRRPLFSSSSSLVDLPSLSLDLNITSKPPPLPQAPPSATSPCPRPSTRPSAATKTSSRPSTASRSATPTAGSRTPTRTRRATSSRSRTSSPGRCSTPPRPGRPSARPSTEGSTSPSLAPRASAEGGTTTPTTRVWQTRRASFPCLLWTRRTRRRLY